MTIGNISTNSINKIGLIWDVSNYVDVSNNQMNIHSNNNITVDSNKLSIGGSEAKTITIGNNNSSIIQNVSSFSVDAKKVVIDADSQLQLIGGDSVITAQSGSIVLNSNNVQIGNETGADIRVKDKLFPDWPTDTNSSIIKYLVYEVSTGTMKWQEVEKTTIVVDDSDTPSPGQNEHQIKFRKVKFQGSDDTAGQSLIKPETGTDPGPLVFKNIIFNASDGSTSKPIGYDAANEGQTDIILKSISGISLLSTDTDKNIDVILSTNTIWGNLKGGVCW